MNCAKRREHILEGLAIALANIDEIIAAIKSHLSPEAKSRWLARMEVGRGAQMLERAGAVSTRPASEIAA